MISGFNLKPFMLQGSHLMQGSYGAFFGIIAGPIGIRLSYVNQIREMKFLWNAFITFVSPYRLLIYWLDSDFIPEKSKKSKS